MRAPQFTKLTAFVAVAEHANFTRAATQLGISNPSLSQVIRSLEDQVGVRLLNRTTCNVALTEAGAELLAHLNPALEIFEKALGVVNAFRAKLGGTLRVAVHPVAAGTIVPSLIARFSAQDPDIRLEIYVDRARADIVGNRFNAGIQVDSGVAQDMIAVPIGAGSGSSPWLRPDILPARSRRPIQAISSGTNASSISGPVRMLTYGGVSGKGRARSN